jgi:hypothetical protein
LLEHLHTVGFTAAPRPLGIDDRAGVEALTARVDHWIRLG